MMHLVKVYPGRRIRAIVRYDRSEVREPGLQHPLQRRCSGGSEPSGGILQQL